LHCCKHFYFFWTTINEFYVGFDGGNKKKEKEIKERDEKRIVLMILGLSIRTFISSLK